jgi:hypothetical protein
MRISFHCETAIRSVINKSYSRPRSQSGAGHNYRGLRPSTPPFFAAFEILFFRREAVYFRIHLQYCFLRHAVGQMTGYVLDQVSALKVRDIPTAMPCGNQDLREPRRGFLSWDWRILIFLRLGLLMANVPLP